MPLRPDTPAPPPLVLDEQLQYAVLHHLLLTYPAWQTAEELTRAFASDDDAAGHRSERDDLARALRDLAGDGLVHRRSGFFVPTRAAVRFSELLDDGAAAG